jgi:hypothetical protein
MRLRTQALQRKMATARGRKSSNPWEWTDKFRVLRDQDDSEREAEK